MRNSRTQQPPVSAQPSAPRPPQLTEEQSAVMTQVKHPFSMNSNNTRQEFAFKSRASSHGLASGYSRSASNEGSFSFCFVIILYLYMLQRSLHSATTLTRYKQVDDFLPCVNRLRRLSMLDSAVVNAVDEFHGGNLQVGRNVMLT